MDQDKTNNAILEQLNYIDNFIDDNNLNLNFDLSAFADDEFIFADEDKPKDDHKQDKDKDKIDLSQFNNLNNLPRFPVPPGAKSSLVQAGLNQNQIDLLSALIAQYQSVQQDEDPNQNPGIPPQQSSQDLLQQNQDISLLQPQQNNQFPFNQTSPGFMNENFLNPMQMNSNSEFSNDIGSSSSTADALNVSSLPATGNSSGENNSSNNSGAEIDNDLDKRRRNTAASARFRIKKKLKEKQMEEKIENLQELISKFENKIENLELENKLLRKVINDKSGEKNDNELKRLKERILRND
ncbi:hypothetical protein CLIB1444_07S01222 [[Candida] jaroonii]|uniref:Uncharacterized protein n=1 Tax=[Candida] jaroonii TaxID=467808 RepID=A0ACA9YA06_9ASCO|nr:hypothetical protein CLIB1444_07S01222 [[Candida] jaroonii]